MKSIGVIGAGTMGCGIALASAIGGYDVVLNDIKDEYLQRATQNIAALVQKSVERGKLSQEDAVTTNARIRTSVVFEDLKNCELVIEAAIEQLPIKRDIFSRLESLCDNDAIFASNTSSLAITAIASACKNPKRVVGLHFFNPAHIMKLVEIIRGEETDDATVATTQAYIKALGKTSVLAKDTPGFIVNRVARNFYGEAFRLVGDQIATVEQTDRIMKANGFAMGPYQLMDLIGIDVNLAVTQSVYDQYFGESRFRPHLLQQKMVEANRLGRKTGRGFYDYTTTTK